LWKTNDFTQGSSSLATLGFVAESLWDSFQQSLPVPWHHSPLDPTLIQGSSSSQTLGLFANPFGISALAAEFGKCRSVRGENCAPFDDRSLTNDVNPL